MLPLKLEDEGKFGSSHVVSFQEKGGILADIPCAIRLHIHTEEADNFVMMRMLSPDLFNLR